MTNDFGEPIAKGGTAALYAYGDGGALKLYRDGFPPEEAEREAEKARVAFAAGIRTPAVREVVTVEGRPGIVFDRVDGPPLAFQMFAAKDKAADGMALMAALHADLHTRRGGALPPLQERWADKIRGAGLPDDLRDFALARLKRLCEMPASTALCHGDFHPLNILLADGDMKAPIIIDWVDATSGPPLADVARTELIMRFAALPDNLPQTERDWLARERDSLTESYLDAYAALRPFDRSEVATWFPVVAAARRHDPIPESEQALMLEIVANALRSVR
jgi:Ser/Thr protein kinase RdoA (MazF antagonist)